MGVISNGAEHQFLTFIEALKINPGGWIACTFPFSRYIEHDNIVSRRAFIRSDLTRLRADALAAAKAIQESTEMLPGVQIYLFGDNDIILLCCPVDEAQQKLVRDTLQMQAAKYPNGFCDYGFLTKEIYSYQKIAESKFLSQKKMKAYEALSDESVVESLALRRRKREEPIILIVEDDRFTASYIGGFLKEYDLVVARNGEEIGRAHV